MNTTAIKTAFDTSANTYDSARRQLIPCFDDFYGTALALIPYQPDDYFSVLDLGAGTGLLSALISERFPNAKMTLMDISEAMLAKARIRFLGESNRFKFVTVDYSEELRGQFDVIVSALSIHHLADNCKATLFQRIYDALPTGGLFINADQVLGATSVIETVYRRTWISEVKNCGVSDTDLKAALERMKEDKMSTLEMQLDWLKKSGFDTVNCWYKNYSFTVFSGQKGHLL